METIDIIKYSRSQYSEVLNIDNITFIFVSITNTLYINTPGNDYILKPNNSHSIAGIIEKGKTMFFDSYRTPCVKKRKTQHWKSFLKAWDAKIYYRCETLLDNIMAKKEGFKESFRKLSINPVHFEN